MFTNFFLYDFVWLQLLLVLCCFLLFTCFSIFSSLILFLLIVFLLCSCFVYINLWAVVVIFLFIEIHLLYMFTCLIMTWLSYENSSIFALMRSNYLNICLLGYIIILVFVLFFTLSLKLFNPFNIDLFLFLNFDNYSNLYTTSSIYSLFQSLYLSFFFTLSFDFCIINILLLLVVLIISSVFLFIQLINLYSYNKNFYFFKNITTLPFELFSRRQSMETQLRRAPLVRVYANTRGSITELHTNSNV